MRTILALLTFALLAACPAKTEPDAGDDAGAFNGETIGGAVPIIPTVDDPGDTDDAGEVVVDDRCCLMTYSVADSEPADATGRLRATYGPAAFDGGVELTRAGGSWSSSVCLPVKSSIRFWFEFTLPAADGGDPTIEVRADETAPTTLGLSGDLVNTFGPVNDCSEVDAGTGSWSP